MAEIVPFRGVLYRDAKNAAKLLAPPYDVLSPADRARYAAMDPTNVVHLILPEGEGDAKYAHAAELWQSWRKDGTLVRDDEPALYRYHQTFEAEGKTYTRKGFIALLKLERFGEGSVMPHERTLSGPKADRLKLMRACKAHFSQIFLLYSDPRRSTDKMFSAFEDEAPLVDANTPDGVRQQLWRITDTPCLRHVCTYLSDQKVYIADGHHRYETMIALRDELKPPTARSAANYGCVFLSNMDDPQLVVLPTHRAVHSLASFDAQKLLERAREHFAVESRPWGDAASVRGILAEKGAQGPTLALAIPGKSAIDYLTLKNARGDELDVTVLHTLVLENILGITREAQEKQTNLHYIKDTAQALAIAQKGENGAQAVFLMNPTKVSQVKAISDAGEVMPQKSTFFVPKLSSGIVMNAIDPSETV